MCLGIWPLVPSILEKTFFYTYDGSKINMFHCSIPIFQVPCCWNTWAPTRHICSGTSRLRLPLRLHLAPSQRSRARVSRRRVRRRRVRRNLVPMKMVRPSLRKQRNHESQSRFLLPGQSRLACVCRRPKSVFHFRQPFLITCRCKLGWSNLLLQMQGSAALDS